MQELLLTQAPIRDVPVIGYILHVCGKQFPLWASEEAQNTYIKLTLSLQTDSSQPVSVLLLEPLLSPSSAPLKR